MLCEGVKIIEIEVFKDHIHTLSEILSYHIYQIFDIYANLKYKYENNHFFFFLYQVDTVGRNQNIIKEYI